MGNYKTEKKKRNKKNRAEKLINQIDKRNNLICGLCENIKTSDRLYEKYCEDCALEILREIAEIESHEF